MNLILGEARRRNGCMLKVSPTTGHPVVILNTSCELVHLYLLFISWDYYVSNIEDDVHGRQERAYKILKELQETEKDKIQLNPVTEEQWIRL
jgi:hypothetical protein